MSDVASASSVEARRVGTSAASLYVLGDLGLVALRAEEDVRQREGPRELDRVLTADDADPEHARVRDFAPGEVARRDHRTGGGPEPGDGVGVERGKQRAALGREQEDAEREGAVDGRIDLGAGDLVGDQPAEHGEAYPAGIGPDPLLHRRVAACEAAERP